MQVEYEWCPTNSWDTPVSVHCSAARPLRWGDKMVAARLKAAASGRITLGHGLLPGSGRAGWVCGALPQVVFVRRGLSLVCRGPRRVRA